MQGFYRVYGAVFVRVADEEADYREEDEEEERLLPGFG